MKIIAKKAISVLCTLAIVLSCMTMLFGMGVSAAEVALTLNNNGVVTEENLEAGAALPTPTSDIEGNTFLGWYTDTTWATAVTEVPAEATTLYAKWNVTVIDFNNVTGAARFTMSSSKAIGTYGEVTAARVNIRSVNGGAKYYLAVPAYDAADAGLYSFEEGKSYSVDVTFSAEKTAGFNILKIADATSNAGDALSVAYNSTGSASTDPPASYETATYNFTMDATSFAAFYSSSANAQNVTYIDKIVVTEVLPKEGAALNNNGVISFAELKVGDAIPTPTSDIEGNKFLGWYTDTTWTTKVETYEEGVTNLYAKWTITKIAFDNISKITKFTDAGEGQIVDGALKAKFHAGNRARNVFIPAYDAADAGCFVFEEGKNYKISFDYMVDATANTKNLYYGWGTDTKNYNTRTYQIITGLTTSETYSNFSFELNDLDIPDEEVTGTKAVMVLGVNQWAACYVWFDNIVIEEIPGTAMIFNNNGEVETLYCEAGDELPTPTSDIEGNVFGGWYADTAFTTKVETMPTETTTLYAKWSTVVIDFNNLTNVSSSEYGNMTRTIADGVLTVNLRGNNAFSLPSYDAAGALPYLFKEGNKYEIAVYLKAAATKDLQFRTSTGYAEGGLRAPAPSGKFVFAEGADATVDFVEATKSLTFRIPDALFGEDTKEAYIGIGYDISEGSVQIDKIVITDLGPACTEHVYDNVLDTECNVCGFVREKHVGKTLVKLDGVWYYVVDGELSTDTTLVKYNGVYYYVKNGVKNDTENTLCKYNGVYYHVKGGKYVKDTTLVKYNSKWYYVENGVYVKKTALVKYGNTYYYVKNGVKTTTANTLIKIDGVWYHVKDGKWAKDTTLVKYTDGVYYYVKDGVKDTTANTLCKYGSAYYHVKGGKWVKDTTLVKYNGKWYYVKNGKYDKTFNGKVLYGGKYYTVKNGVKV